MAKATLEPGRIRAVILDMDGVLTDTARVHEAAWADLFNGFLERRGEPCAPFTSEDYRRHVDGKPRLDGVRDFLAARGIELAEGSPDDPPDASTIHGLGKRKNRAFQAAIERQGVEAFPDAVAFLDRLERAGIASAAISASRNADRVLRAAGLRDRFAVLIDGEVAADRGLAGKPAPDVFLAAAAELGATPGQTAVAEDAVSGIEAAKRGRFACILGIARNQDGADLRAAGADIVVPSFTAVEIAGEEPLRERHDLPDAFEVIEELKGDEGGSRAICLFLDYDGTLTPIVERPEDADLSPAMRQRLERVAARHRTAVISGRGLDDLLDRVAVPDIFYAASHGFELRHPSGEVRTRDEAEAAAARIGDLEQALQRAFAAIDGIQLERKRFGIAVHYRRAAADAEPEVERLLERVAADFPELTVKAGKKVREFVPAVDWHKGKALMWIMESTGLTPENAYPIYIGDDVTDEDAFETIDDWGCGIVVGVDGPTATAAYFFLEDVEAVGRFLDALADVP